MKTRYRVLVQEKYSKWVDVYAHSEADMEDEVRTMEEAGEIEWDRGEDFDEWNILKSEEDSYTNLEVTEAKKWCKDQVITAWTVYPGHVMKMNRLDCVEWLERLRDNGVDIPECIDSGDLWDAVLDGDGGFETELPDEYEYYYYVLKEAEGK